MAITDAQKVDYLWNKVGYGVSKTAVNATKNATNESIASPALLRGDKVMAQSGSIPGTIPTATTALVKIYDDSGNGTATVETTEDTTAPDNRTWKTGLTDWIPPEFGSTYQVKVYADAASQTDAQTGGTQLFAAGSGNNDEWFFDYQSGVLHFIGTNLPTAIGTGTSNKIYIAGARYIGTFGVGGASIALDDISNVSATSPSNGDLLKYNSSSGNWEKSSVSSLGLATQSDALAFAIALGS